MTTTELEEVRTRVSAYLHDGIVYDAFTDNARKRALKRVLRIIRDVEDKDLVCAVLLSDASVATCDLSDGHDPKGLFAHGLVPGSWFDVRFPRWSK